MNAMTPATACRCGAPSFARQGASPGKGLRRLLARMRAWRRAPGIEEQYLAQAVDAQDFQVRLHALERARP